MTENSSKESLIGVNKELIRQDKQKIDSFLKRKKWNMNINNSGLYYVILTKGNGDKAEAGRIAEINYKINLLDGTTCYDSDILGSKKFTIGAGNVEKGLEEGILYLHEGDKARFIMPPHLAHGLLGDENKIPARAIIIYEVELLELK